MLKNLNFIILIFLISNICAQSVPDKFNYQVSVRDQSGKALSDRLCSFQISILDNLNASTYVYSEIHKNIQTRFGVASFQIGTGTPKANSTSISSIPFLSSSYYIKIEVDTDNGSAFSEISRTQLISVPYAVVAKESQIAKSLDPNAKIKLNQLDPSGANSDAVIKFKNNAWTIGTDNGSSASYTAGKGINISNSIITNTGDDDSSPTNELQDLALNGNDLNITKSNQPPIKLSNLSLAGDVSGSINSNSVVKLQGRMVSSIAPMDGQYLKWVNLNNRWEPSSLTSGGQSNWQLEGSDIKNSNSGNVNVMIGSSSTFNIIGPGSGNNFTFSMDGNGKPSFDLYAGGGLSRAGFRYINNQWEVFASRKMFIQDHPLLKSKVIVFSCIEGPESAAYERGTGQLINGRAEIKYSENFNLIINSNTVTISLTPISIDSKGLAIIEKIEKGFIVGELNGGSGNYKFDWEVKGVRKGMEDFRVIRDKSEYEASNLNVK